MSLNRVHNLPKEKTLPNFWSFVALFLCVTMTYRQAVSADRKDGAGQAAAMAAMGAAVAGASCVMLMKAAQEEEDPSMKAMLQSQAMQQCMQAAKSAADGQQNSDNKDTMTSPKEQSVPSLAANPSDERPSVQTPTNPGITLPDQTPRDTELPTNPEIAKETPVAPEVFQPAPVLNNVGFEDKPKAPPSLSQLDPIKYDAVGFDDSKNPGVNSGADGGLGSSPFSSLFGAGSNTKAPSSDSDLRKLAADLNAESDGRRKSKDEAGASHGSGSEGGADTTRSNKGSDDGFASMLSSLMGGGPKAESVASGGPEGFDNGAKRPGSKKPPNIFQYASFRYRKISSTGLVKKAVSSKDSGPKRVIASSKTGGKR